MARLSDTAIILFDLLKISLWQNQPEVDYGCISDETWREVYQLSHLQGVYGLTLDGVMQLPEAWQPDEELLLAWMANTVLLEERALHNNKKVNELNRIFSARQLNMLLLKGMGLAAFYPKPLHREYGDIDIFLYGNHAEGDLCLRDWGMAVKDMPKHSIFRFRGVPVENHRTLINLAEYHTIFYSKRRQHVERIEKSLSEILDEEPTCMVGEENIKVPSATFNFIFMTLHAGTHLPNELAVRHLCDWACFLSANKGKYDEDRIEAVLENTNFGKLASEMTNTVIHYLGMPVDFAPCFINKYVDKRLNNKLLHSLFHRFPNSTQVAKNTVWCKWNRFRSKQWKYNLVNQEYLPERLCRAIILWVKKYYNNPLKTKDYGRKKRKAEKRSSEAGKRNF